MLGTNDCKSLYNASAEVIGLGIEQLLKQIRKIDSDTRILLISPIQLGEGVWEPEFDPEFNQKSVEVSKKLKGDIIVDISSTTQTGTLIAVKGYTLEELQEKMGNDKNFKVKGIFISFLDGKATSAVYKDVPLSNIQ